MSETKQEIITNSGSRSPTLANVSSLSLLSPAPHTHPRLHHTTSCLSPPLPPTLNLSAPSPPPPPTPVPLHIHSWRYLFCYLCVRGNERQVQVKRGSVRGILEVVVIRCFLQSLILLLKIVLLSSDNISCYCCYFSRSCIILFIFVTGFCYCFLLFPVFVFRDDWVWKEGNIRKKLQGEKRQE